MSTKSIPDGYPVIAPYLVVKGGAAAIDFYKTVFGATERMRMADPASGALWHAELLFGTSLVMLGDECPEMKALGPLTIGGSPVGIHLYVEDVDATVARAIDAGAQIVHPVENKFYGDRSGSLTDPFGHLWHIATHVEDVSPEETARRAAAMASGEK